MEYITVKEASLLWKIDVSTIGKLLRAGKIAGAKRLGGHWVIPNDSPKPFDGRTKAAKQMQNTAGFRFPLFVNFQEEYFYPALSPEESKLRQAQKNFYACEFEKSKHSFEKLSEGAANPYVKICACCFMCVLAAIYDKQINQKKYYYSMRLLLSRDFPYKKEAELFLALYNFYMGYFNCISENLRDDLLYEYHPSALYMKAFLSIFKLQSGFIKGNISIYVDSYQTLCRLMERDGYYIEAQNLHIALFISYYIEHNQEAMRYHLKKAINIAYEYNLIYLVADAEAYYSDEIEAILADYPATFAKQIRQASKIISENFASYSKQFGNTRLFAELSKTDFRYTAYAISGYTNKQIADILNVSERTVAKRYNDIYDKLVISGKQELIREIETALGKKTK